MDIHGRLGRIRVTTPPSVLDGASIEALAQWEFTPALKGGRPVAIVIRVETEFKLK